MTELSHKLDVSQTFLSNIENDKKSVSKKLLNKFSEYYNVPVSEFLQIKEISNKNNFSYKRIFLEVVETYLKYNNSKKTD